MSKEIEKVDILECICCDTILQLNSFDLWESGIYSEISGHYGTVYDTDIFEMVICDSCIEKKIDQGKLLYKGRHTFDTTNYDEEYRSIKKFKLREMRIKKIIENT